MKIPIPKHLFTQNILPKKVYFFSSTQLNTLIPHYFICISRAEDDMLILVCCTSQFEKRKRFIELRNLPFSTLVWIPPNEENGLEIDSYVDCNSYFDYTAEELWRLYDADNLDFKGEISNSHFQQIVLGLKESPLIEESIKELLPNI